MGSWRCFGSHERRTEGRENTKSQVEKAQRLLRMICWNTRLVDGPQGRDFHAAIQRFPGRLGGGAATAVARASTEEHRPQDGGRPAIRIAVWHAAAVVLPGRLHP